MKKINIILIILIWVLASFSFERWEVYTNTSHVYQTLLNDSELISVSWGGIEEYELKSTSASFEFDLLNKYTTINGLSSNEVRTLYLKDHTIWAGSYNNGVSIVENGRVFLINADNGLHSDKVIAINPINDLVCVVTEGGFSTFYDLDEVSFPILSRKYSESSTSGALISNQIYDIAIYQDYVFLATDAGLNYFLLEDLDNFDRWQSINKSNSPLLSNKIIKLAVKDNKLALAGDNSIQVVTDYFTNPNWDNYSFLGDNANSSLDDIFIKTISFNDNGEILFSTGIWDETITTFSDLSDSILQKITSQGDIEPVLTTSTPIFKTNSNSQETITLNKIGLKYIESTQGKIILSTWGAGILIFDNNKWYQFQPNGIGFNAINHLTVDHDNKLWASCGYFGIAALRKGARGVSSFDGNDWETLNMNNSPLQSDNINSITVGSDNKKWFGSWYAEENHPQGWKGGATSYNENTNDWQWYYTTGVFEFNHETDSFSNQISGLSGLTSQTVSFLNTDLHGNIIMSLQGYGVAFYSPNGDQRLAISPLYGSQNNFTRRSHHNEYGYFFSKSVAASGESAGLLHWDSQELPNDGDISAWTTIPVSDIRNSVIYDMIDLSTPYGNQFWVASSKGLFMYDGDYWYRYGIDIKRERWISNWQIETRYFVGETKLFAAKETYPTALALDDYGCLWIGSDSAGLTKYDTNTEEFFVYDISAYPLISNQITALAYEPQSGKLYIGAAEGLSSLTVGSSINTQTKFNKVVAVPNPFYPERGDVVRIFNEPDDFMPNSAKICKIFDKSGQLIYDLPLNKYQSFSWDGNNKNGKKCSSGVYFYVISASNGETKRGKIALIRE